ncbi:proteinase-activated receptor 2-like [Colossoma macropomum]|uniref:proteinase-activated receptor 2-like n=1 Tax=Colossoma macropomum TaxID=42526 RepID=UPI001863DFC2|nr:proteinase-activated receptor 2-like [Colossoma macropomum]
MPKPTSVVVSGGISGHGMGDLHMCEDNYTVIGLRGYRLVAEDELGVNVTNTAVSALDSNQTTVFLPLVYIFIFIVGLPTNAMAIWVFLFRTKKKHPGSILMANLALADLLFIVWLPLKIAYHFNGNDWIFGEPLCKVLVGFFYGNMYCSTFFIACISVQRYWMIVYPFSRKPNAHVTVCICVCVWIVVWVLTVPLYLYDQTVKILNLNIITCHDVTRSNQTLFPVGYFLTMGTVGYVVPCMVCIVSYLLTFLSLRRSIIGASSNERKKKAIILMVTVLVMFLVCFTPSNVMLMVHYSLPGAELQDDFYGFYVVALGLGSLNSCLDPFVYYYISQEFRKQVKNSLMCCNECTTKWMTVSSRPMKITGEIPMSPTNTTTSTVEHSIEDSQNAAQD